MFIRYSFLADTVTVDASGKLNAIGIFDNIFAAQFPSIHRDMTLVINLEGTVAEKGEHDLSVELRDDKANRLAAFDQKINIQNAAITKGSLRANVIFKLQDLPFQRHGQYEFVFFIDGRFLGRVLFIVQRVDIKKAGEA
ncbi:MAG: hypothetical protein HY033_11575 [Ignavibacteriae bacterium]|nr:hypothetical protein [Ignavibacteria bacterium]MBI3365537.1 hypothetical protein [Ignavibacteriota bacterium]